MHLAKKKLKQLREAKGIKEGTIPPARVNDEFLDSDNTRVKEVESKLGPYTPPAEPKDLARREKRSAIQIDNGLVYLGEW